MAMMASGTSGNPYEDTTIEQDLIDPDDGKLPPNAPNINSLPVLKLA